jgi:zinc/manganese transport system permease protein
MFAPYMLNTWIAATLIAAVAGLIGFFVVLRGASFAAHALPLGTFPGAAGAALLGIAPIYGLFVFAALGVLGISRLRSGGRPEIATALSLVTLLGLGALFLSLSQSYAQATYALLFGEVLGVGTGDLAPLAAASALAVVLILVLFRPLLLASVSPDLAQARGVSAARMELAFLAILALATSAALPVVGALLVFSLTVGPASAARMIAVRPVPAMLLSAGLAVLTVWAAIALAFAINWPIGFFVGALSAAAYAGGRLWRSAAAAQAAHSPSTSTVAMRG